MAGQIHQLLARALWGVANVDDLEPVIDAEKLPNTRAGSSRPTSTDGRLMDGGHRIARAWLEGLAWVDAVRFEVDPEPDWVVSDS
ncbi:MAG: hypothetical protein WKF79_08650 [Nocardioides sp.]